MKEFEERRSRAQCTSHEATMLILEKIRIDMRWHNVIGKALFACSLVLIGLALSSLVYFGSLEERVSQCEEGQNENMQMIHDLEVKVDGIHDQRYKTKH